MIWITSVWKAVTSPIGLILIGLVIFVVYSYAIYREGQISGAYEVINKQNAADKEVVEGARNRRDDIDRCRAAGGMWERSAGKCT